MLIAMSFSLFGLSSCKKEEETAKEKIQDKDFVVINQIEKENNQVVSNYADLETCERDNIYRFNSNSFGYVDEATLKCDTFDDQRYNFSWGLANNDTKLNIFFDYVDLTTFDIVQNNGTILKLYALEKDGDDTYSFEITLQKK